MHSSISLHRHHPPTLLSSVLLAAAIATAGFAQDAARMAEIIKTHAAGDRFMGSVLVAKDGAVVFEQSCGWANAGWKIPNTATTKFRLGSVTKQFTAAAILFLAEQGKLQLDDPLSKFVNLRDRTWRCRGFRHRAGNERGQVAADGRGPEGRMAGGADGRRGGGAHSQTSEQKLGAE
ncbi:MAG: serine hydrolase domain-containing protein [Opitutaceae bacterium]|nr:serine hydrolase domain-containing protein [Opitutaceae bacterium]